MKKLSAREVKRGLDNSIKDGACTGAASGAVSTFLTPYALALGANAAQIGLLTAIPQLASTVLQPLAGTFIGHAASRKKITGALTLVSRLSLVPLVLLAFSGGVGAFYILLLSVSIYTAFAGSAIVAWASWMGDLVPEKTRGKYFGKRNTFIGIASLASTLSGGWMLGMTKTLSGFAAIFAGALLLYFIALHYLVKIPEPRTAPISHKGHKVALNAAEFLSSMKKTNFRHFMMYAVLFDFSVFLAAPFFAVYMLDELNIGYWWFSVATSASVVSSIISQRYWGKLADRHGDRNVIAVCSALASMVPILFVLSRSVFSLVLANIFSGFAWAGLNLAVFNFILDSSPPQKRPQFISNYQFFDGLAVAGGAMAGGLLVHAFGGGFFGLSGIAIVFVLAAAMRGAFTLIFLPKLKEERLKSRKILPARDVFLHAVVLYPSRGISHQMACIYRRARRIDRTAGKDIRMFFDNSSDK